MKPLFWREPIVCQTHPDIFLGYEDCDILSLCPACIAEEKLSSLLSDEDWDLLRCYAWDRRYSGGDLIDLAGDADALQSLLTVIKSQEA